MRIRIRPFTAAAIALLAAFTTHAPSTRAQPSQWEWDGVSRIVAMSDIHGAYPHMIALLQGTGLVDGNLKWTGGETHLVFCGDLVDRGPGDRSVLDLARRLQTEAEADGGRVHLVLGNHEIMILTRDVRYVSKKSFAEFARDETQNERNQAFRSFRTAHAGKGVSTSELRAAFEEEHPPGYFAHRRAFALDGEYGSWLMQQPTVVKVNGMVFLHGGLTRRVAALGLDEINRQMTTSVRQFVEGAVALGSTVPFPADFSKIVQTASSLGKSNGSARKVLKAFDDGLAFAPAGPVWYRGSAVENERLERDRITEALDSLGAHTVVVGHTVTRTHRISSRFDGRLYRVDVGMGYGRPPYALVVDEAGPRVFEPATGALTAALEEPPQGERWPKGEEDLAHEVLEKFLRQADIKSALGISVEGLPVQILELERDEMLLRAIFGFARETAAEAAVDGREARRHYKHQAAAYQLDRLMELGNVPVTVLRKVDGTDGVVQIWVQDAVDVVTIEDRDDWSVLDGLESKIAEVRAFSGMIGIERRLDVGRLILPISRRVLISDNGVSFPERGEIAPYLPEGCGPVGPAFIKAVKQLDGREVQKEMKGLLSREQVDALMARRDGLVELCANPSPDWSLQKLIEMRP